MNEKFLLYLTDDEVTLSRGHHEILYHLKGAFEDARQDLESIVLKAPKTPLRLLIDRSHQDIREEKLPPLHPWDRIRFLSHKKAEWQSQGVFFGFHFLKQDKETYFRWIHISQNDSLFTWLLWLKSLINPSGGVFFVPLEACRFLKKNLPNSNGYQMILYPISSSETRHIIFQRNRLLLSRLSEGEEGIKSSLHFLSRNYPDINENLTVKTLSDHQILLSFLATQKRPSLILRNVSSRILWLRVTAGFAQLSILFATTIMIYQGYDYKINSRTLLAEIPVLKNRVLSLKNHIGANDVASLRSALLDYQYLKSRTINPLKSFEKLASLLKEDNLRLENLSWQNRQELEIIMSFLMKNEAREMLATRFERFLDSCRNGFPKSQIYVLEGPYNSGIHEVFKNPTKTSLPLAQVRIRLP
ncbi:MAG TPA: hypothetical protein VMW10_06605 [Alphaproteobacteria bacterium]|nr:hypothetical protein [Alphaproteobacteria bacterium]